MSWWNAKYTNNNGEYEITFASKDYEKAKAVEKVCCAVMDRDVRSPMDVEVVVRCRECKLWLNSKLFPHNHYCIRSERVAYPDDFCSYGEKRCDEDGTT